MGRVITKEEKQGFIGTIVFHVILILIFVFFGLTKLIPPPDYGINLNFGTSNTGSGDVQPIANENPTPPPPQQTETVAAPQVKENVMTQEDVESVKVEEPTPEELERKKQADAEKKRLEEEAEIKRQEELAEQKRQEEFKAKINGAFSNNSNDANSQGNDSGDGDKGSVDGNENPGAYSGLPGTGGGTTGLGGSGRTWNEVKPQGVQNEEGKVEVLVFVDANGKVTKARIHTSTNSLLNANALAAAKKWKFSDHPELGSSLQKIIIPFVFTF